MAENKNSRARIEANNRYNAKAYDRINVAVPKGRKDIIKAHAEKNGECVYVFVNRSTIETLLRVGVFFHKASSEIWACLVLF